MIPHPAFATHAPVGNVPLGVSQNPCNGLIDPVGNRLQARQAGRRRFVF